MIDLQSCQLVGVDRDEMIVAALAEALETGDHKTLTEVAAAILDRLLMDLADQAEHFH